MPSYRLALLLLLAAVSACRASCPTGWEPYGSKCYKLMDTPKYWEDTDAACGLAETGATLASVHDIYLNDFLIITVAGDNFAWIGLRRATTTSAWTWTDGSSYNYNNWMAGEPLGDGEICAQLCDKTNGEWCAWPCGVDGHERPFICQVDA